MSLTIENMVNFKSNCDHTDKIAMYMNSCYLSPKVISEAIECLNKKVISSSIGLDTLNPADKMLFLIIEAQNGFHF